jgi:hypothetical protein
MNNDDKQRIKAMFPHASAYVLEHSYIDTGVRPKADQPTPRKALERPVEGKKEMPARISVCYVLYRVRLLDPDSIHNATKVCTDCLCQAGLLPGDGPEQIDLQVTQQKVAHLNEQRTTLKITYP